MRGVRGGVVDDRGGAAALAADVGRDLDDVRRGGCGAARGELGGGGGLQVEEALVVQALDGVFVGDRQLSQQRPGGAGKRVYR